MARNARLCAFRNHLRNCRDSGSINCVTGRFLSVRHAKLAKRIPVVLRVDSLNDVIREPDHGVGESSMCRALRYGVSDLSNCS